MAREETYGYLDIGTNKYGWSVVFPGQGPWYGGRSGDPAIIVHHMYGIKLPPPIPTGFSTDVWPIDPDEIPTFIWQATLPDEYYYGEPIEFQIEINYDSPDFTSPTFTVGPFTATSTGGGWWSYQIPDVSALPVQGIYYARVRSRNSLMWSGWSSTLRWEYSKVPPPPPTIDPVTSPTMEFTQLITGSKSPDSHVFIRNNGGSWQEVTYTYGISGGRWSYTMTLSAGGNSIEAISNWNTDLSTGNSSPAYAFILVVFSTVEPYNIWNCFDELGLLVSLPRILGEKNKPYKKRILDVFVRPGNSTHDGLVNAISRELSIPPSSVAVYRLSDLADSSYSGNILNADGNAIGTKLEDYAKEVYDHNPIFWGNLVCDESVWDAVDSEYTGYSYLPHLWDPSASGIYTKWQKPGIGDQDDLLVNDVVSVTDHEMSTIAPSGSSLPVVAWDVEHWRLPVHSGYFYVKDPSLDRYFIKTDSTVWPVEQWDEYLYFDEDYGYYRVRPPYRTGGAIEAVLTGIANKITSCLSYIGTIPVEPSGLVYDEFYLYAQKCFEDIPCNVSAFVMASGVKQNAPVVITESGYLTTRSTDPWAQVTGSGKWDEVAMGSFSLDPLGSYNTNKKEFYMDPAASGRIVFNQTLSTNLYVEYESSDTSYYYVDNIDVNPIMRETDGGFLQIAEVNDGMYMSLQASQTIVKSDGFDRSLLTATLWDRNLSKVSNKTIVFEMIFSDVYDPLVGSLIPGVLNGQVHKYEPSTGFICETTAITDYSGKCTATFLTNGGEKGAALIKAYYADASGIYDAVTITSYNWEDNIFTLDVSILDGLDYLI